MCKAFETLVALRYLRARRQEGLISVIAVFSLVGITLGVATLIVVLSVMSGVREELIKSIIGLEGHVTVYASGPGISDYDRVARSIAEIPGVTSAAPKIEGQIMVSYKGAAMGALVSAYRYEDLQYKPLLIDRVSEGAIQSLKDSSYYVPPVYGQGEHIAASSVILGSRMAERLRVKAGDNITLISPEGRATVAGFMPRVKSYPVGGLFTIGMASYDNSLVVMPFAEAQIYFKLRSNGMDAATMIEIMLDRPDDAPVMAKTITETLGPGYRIYDWKTSNSHIFQAVMVQRNVAFFIVMLIILVAAFNIISSLIMLVREKERQVAILRTLGATRGSILRIFFMCGASIGVLGTFIGVVLGLLIGWNTENIQRGLESMMGHRLFADELYFLSHLPSQVNGGEVLMVVAMSLALSFLATLYPAYKAASVEPAEALRYE
jgi:lipoprotein-releasing system permease protein